LVRRTKKFQQMFGNYPVAGEAGVPLFYMSRSDFDEGNRIQFECSSREVHWLEVAMSVIKKKGNRLETNHIPLPQFLI
jgi:hypothetical protein